MKGYGEGFVTGLCWGIAFGIGVMNAIIWLTS